MSIPHIDPADLGDANQFKLFAANIQTFKELLLSRDFYKAVQIGTQLQEDLDNNPGWRKYFSIKRELSEAAVFLKMDEGKEILKKLKIAKKANDLPAITDLVQQLEVIQDFLNREHYFTESFSKPIAEYKKWITKQTKKEASKTPNKRKSPPPVNPTSEESTNTPIGSNIPPSNSPINSPQKSQLLPSNPILMGNPFLTSPSSLIEESDNTDDEIENEDAEQEPEQEESNESPNKDEGAIIQENGINEKEEQEALDQEEEKEEHLSPTPTTKKVTISPDFFKKQDEAAAIDYEIEAKFGDEIISLFKHNAPHFKVIRVKTPKIALFGKFQWYAVYFDSDTRICTIIFIQPIPLLGTLNLSTGINYQPSSQCDSQKITEFLQSQIFDPYTDYKNAYENLEDNELSELNTALEMALQSHFRKCRILKTANSFAIEFQKFRYALDLRAYFPLRCKLDYSGKNLYPGIPPIKLFFVPFERREIWTELLPFPQKEQRENKINQSPPNQTSAFHLKKFQNIWNKSLSVIFCCGLMQIVSYFINSLPLFWGSMIIILLTGILLSGAYLSFIRRQKPKIQTHPSGLITPNIDPSSNSNSISKSKGKKKPKPINSTNTQFSPKTLNVNSTFAKQTLLEFLNDDHN